jgi:hypothetical protein
MNRLTFLITLFLILSASTQSYGIVGLGAGVRGGVVSNYDNPELAFEEAKSIDIDQLTMVGGHFRISSLPVFTYEVFIEHSWHSEDFKVLGTSVSTKVRDFAIGANIKYAFKVPVITPYVGGGIASHQMTYEFDPSLGSILNGVNVVVPEDGPQLGIHGLGGVAFSVPASPLEFFLEGRIGRISGDEESANYSSIYGGVTLKLL